MQYQVPQFIEVEDKIVGQLTLKQFLYLAGGIGGSVALFLYVPYKLVSILLILPLVVFSLALAFYKINNKPFIDTVQASFYYFLSDKLYLWKKVDKKPISQIIAQAQGIKSAINVPKMSDSKLKDLTWSLVIKESLNPVTRQEP